MKRNYEKTLRIILFGIGLGLLCLSFYFVWVEFYNHDIRLPFYRRGNYFLTIMYGIILFVCMMIMKGQYVGEARLLEVVVSQCISACMAAVIVYFPMSLLQYELMSPWPLALLLVAQWALIALWNALANRIYFSLVPPLKILLVYEDDKRSYLAEKLNNISQRYSVCGEISIHEGQSAIREQIRDYEAVLLSVKNEAWHTWLVRLCFKRNIRVFLAPTLEDVIINSARSIHPVDTPLLCSADHRLTIEERALKRTVDIFGAALALLLFSPLLIFAALAIKLGDGGPVFFMQERLTRDGKRFRICKFRSMVVDAEKGGQRLAAENDERITRAGRVLRKLRLDELPQLFNVLKGDMSLVGPRPECPALAAEYEKKLPEFAYRLKVKAGITGYAQVYGDYTTDPADKLLMDIMYIESQSFALDISLLLLTIRTLFIIDKTKGTQAEHPAETEVETR